MAERFSRYIAFYTNGARTLMIDARAVTRWVPQLQHHDKKSKHGCSAHDMPRRHAAMTIGTHDKTDSEHRAPKAAAPLRRDYA